MPVAYRVKSGVALPGWRRCSSLPYRRYSQSSRPVRERGFRRAATTEQNPSEAPRSSSADFRSVWLVKSALGAMPDFHHGLLGSGCSPAQSDALENAAGFDGRVIAASGGEL
jgi:hypothetical protein